MTLICGSSIINVSTSLAILIYSCTSVVTAWPLTDHKYQFQAKNDLYTQRNYSTLQYLEKTFRGLDLSLDFFWREKEHVNLDTIIGTRIVEATMNLLLERYHYSSNHPTKIPSAIIDRLFVIRNSARDVSNATIPFIIRNEPDYYAKIGTILNPGIFQLNYSSRDVSPSVPIWPYNPDEAMDEEESDDCLAEIFGTRTGRTCDIASSCWEKMTKYGYNEYSLSHEIFYLEIAEGFGCHLEMLIHMLAFSQLGRRSLHELYCANMLTEAHQIAMAGYPPEMRDLFMEQAALCGIVGYREFFSSEWLAQILSWQNEKDGCYKWDGWPQTDDASETTPSQRVKREERRVTRGCLCHRTTVAASALALYVRYILEVWLGGEMQRF